MEFTRVGSADVNLWLWFLTQDPALGHQAHWPLFCHFVLNKLYNIHQQRFSTWIIASSTSAVWHKCAFKFLSSIDICSISIYLQLEHFFQLVPNIYEANKSVMHTLLNVLHNTPAGNTLLTQTPSVCRFCFLRWIHLGCLLGAGGKQKYGG